MTTCEYCGLDRTPDQLIVKHTKFHADIFICKDERLCNVPRTINDGRNYEFRSVPGVADSLTVSRDGEVRINGKDVYDISRKGIRQHDGTSISIQMAIHLAFPDIPMRHTPTR